MNIFLMPPVSSQNFWPWRRPPSMSPKVATTEPTPRMIPTICRTLRLLWAPMSTTPSTTESHEREEQVAQGAEAGHAGQVRAAGKRRVQAVVLDLAVHDRDDALAALGDARVVGDDHDRLALRVHLRRRCRGSRGRSSCRGCRWARRPGSATGWFTIARAMAARCRWPPESSAGPVLRALAEPDRVERRAGRAPSARGRRRRRRAAAARRCEQRGLRQQVEGLEHEADLLVADGGELEAARATRRPCPRAGSVPVRSARRGSPGCA